MSSHPQSIPKAPAERTLFAAVTVLILVALAQVIAAGVALFPRIDFDRLGRALDSHPAKASAAPVLSSETANAERSGEANALLAEGAKFRETGNFQGALEAVTEADRLVPDKPGILIQMASDYAMMGRNPDAIAVLRRIVALPPSSDPADAAYVQQAKAALMQLGAADAAAGANASAGAVPSHDMRDDVGIPIGSLMGIIDARLLDNEPGMRNLRVSVKAASGQKIDPAKVHATVDFYEQDDNAQILHNDASLPFVWLSPPPIDWASGDPEIFQVKYRLPLEDRGDLPPLQYYGYVIAIYYNGELQDQRAEPPELLNKFPPPLSKNPPVE